MVVIRSTLVKPTEVKTVAKTFTSNIKNLEKIAYNNHGDVFKLSAAPKPAQKISARDLSQIKGEISSYDKIKPMAKKFCEQITSAEVKNYEKLIFSYRESTGEWGELKDQEQNLRFVIKIKPGDDYNQEDVDVFSLSQTLVPSGPFVQIKGWGNSKEYCIVNALKNSFSKFNIPLNNYGNLMVHSYRIASETRLADGGFLCKVNITPGELPE